MLRAREMSSLQVVESTDTHSTETAVFSHSLEY